MKKLTPRKLAILVLVIILYSNIGWVVGSYYYHNIVPVAPKNLTNFGKVMAGGWAFFSEPDKHPGMFFGAIIPGVMWPIFLIVMAFSWIVYFIFYGAYYVGWFIFGGGGAKLLGLV